MEKREVSDQQSIVEQCAIGQVELVRQTANTAFNKDFKAENKKARSAVHLSADALLFHSRS